MRPCRKQTRPQLNATAEATKRAQRHFLSLSHITSQDNGAHTALVSLHGRKIAPRSEGPTMKALGFVTPMIALAMMAAPGAHAQYGQPSPQQQDAYRQQQQDAYRQQQQEAYRQQQQNGYGDNNRQWDSPPAEYSQVGQQGFRDGIEAARNDWQAHRAIDARRSQNYRHPPTQRNFRDEYRNSFARGYQLAVQHRQDEQMREQNRNRDDRDHHDRDRDHDNQQPYGNQSPR